LIKAECAAHDYSAGVLRARRNGVGDDDGTSQCDRNN
jgi:hypothetical protein